MKTNSHHHPLHVLYYNFAHVVLPHLTYSNPLAMRETLMDVNNQKGLLKLWILTAQKLKLDPETIPMNIVCEKVKNSQNGIELYLISFPPPLEIPEVYFEVLMFKVFTPEVGKEQIKKVMIFTLEKSTQIDMLCGWDDNGKRHVNFGPLKSNQKSDFINRVKEIMVSIK